MNEISQLLQQRFGLSADQAQEAETAILNLVRSKVPASFQGMFDSVVGQGGGQAQADGQSESGGQGGELGSLLGSAESMLGMKS